MPTYKYRPNHPSCDEFGMVEAHLAYDYAPGAAPNIISDTMPPTRHMADNNTYESKSQFRKATKAAGCLEVGNDYSTKARPQVTLDRGKRRDDIRRAFYEVRNGIQRG